MPASSLTAISGIGDAYGKQLASKLGIQTPAQLLGAEKQIIATELDGVTPDDVQHWQDEAFAKEVAA